MSVAEKLKAIADKIRARTYSEERLTLDDMANGIDAVYNDGVSEGYANGYVQGLDEGKKDAYDEFWDIFQQNGNRIDYYRAFGGVGFNDETYKPKYDMYPKWDVSGMFCKSRMSNIYWNGERELIIDFSQATNFTQTFSNAAFPTLKTIDGRKATALTQICQSATELVEIEKLIIKDDGSQEFKLSFDYCSKLEKITFEGVIGKNINFQWSPLTEASIRSVIGALSRTATGQTLTLKKDAKEAAFTESDWAALIAEVSNQYNGTWTISLL